MTWYFGLLIGLIVGCSVGVLLAGLLCAASRADRYEFDDHERAMLS